ncbi:MAG: glutaredoxin family protein [Anaerolineales bacterium]
MLTVTLFTRKDCHLCEQAKADLIALQEIIPHQLIEIDIDQDEALVKTFALEIPVVQVGPYTIKAPFDRQKLQVTLGAANDRKNQLDKIGNKEYQERVARGQKVSGADRFTYWFSRHYLLVINLMVLIYVGLPLLAPVLMKVGLTLPATGIYKIYGGMCHQLSYRSWFLFGEQPVYPRAAAHVDGYLTFNQATGLDEEGLIAARQFVGNEIVGYKTALCERDMAIYGAMLLFGVLYALTGRRWRSLPIWAWILIGVMPIAVDGVSQLLSQWAAMPELSFLQPIFGWLPYRESTPFLRTLTGFLFGFSTAWFGYPLIEDAMADTRRVMTLKMAKLKQTDGQNPEHA